ncbi:hypothetical protein ABT397_31350, partial [Streptomyces halstedii]
MPVPVPVSPPLPVRVSVPLSVRGSVLVFARVGGAGAGAGALRGAAATRVHPPPVRGAAPGARAL